MTHTIFTCRFRPRLDTRGCKTRLACPCAETLPLALLKSSSARCRKMHVHGLPPKTPPHPWLPAWRTVQTRLRRHEVGVHPTQHPPHPPLTAPCSQMSSARKQRNMEHSTGMALSGSPDATWSRLPASGEAGVVCVVQLYCTIAKWPHAHLVARGRCPATRLQSPPP